ncbi:MAG: hypothetical protein RJA98_2092 [Pseudomonadota bacterium]
MKRPIVVWACLCALTVASVLLAESGRWRSATPVLIVLIAAVKSRMVILNYMEARHALAHWRFLYETWNFAVAATLIMGSLLA